MAAFTPAGRALGMLGAMKTGTVRLFQTLEHPCGYYPGRRARNLVIDPLDPALPGTYEAALGWGFRRAGGHVYRPHCQGCQACVPCRIPVARFQPRRAQRRCLARNGDLEVRWRPASADPEAMALYRRYLAWRHPGGGMDDPGPDEFQRFLLAPWGDTWLLELRLGTELVAVAVTDVGRQALSAVYTFFSPDHGDRSPGVLCILQQVERARALGLHHLYLGYWLAGHEKMHYKTRFRPLEILRQGHWQDYHPDTGADNTAAAHAAPEQP